MTNEDLQQIQGLVNNARRVLILTHRDPGIDPMASALALYLAMTKMGKDAMVAMETLPLVEVGNLVGIDKVKTSLSGKNLLLTYQPYNLGDFEKVTYLEDQGQPGRQDDSFKLTITPKEGFTPDPKNFRFSSTGAAADLIFTVEVLEPTQLGTIYDPALFTAAPVINIDNRDPNRDYGRFNLVEPEAASLSEITTFFLRAVGTQLDADITGNLYQGIAAATNNFQSPKVAAATFEAAAICLRQGAKQKQTGAAGTIPAPQPRIVPPAVPPAASPQPPAAGNPPPATSYQPSIATPQPVPPDWLGPKAYRGTSVS